MTFSDHFSAVAARYAEYRPHYPEALVATLVERCTDHAVAWDAGCGNGQLSVALGIHFAHVIATDPAEAQLAAARPHPRVAYRRATAEVSELPPASVDLVVAAQAAHWFDWSRYLAEVARVAKPGALVGVVSYGIGVVDGPANAEVARFYRDDVAAYWPPGRAHVENGYRDLVWPWPAVDAPTLEMAASWTRDELVGYISTWSATSRLVAHDGPAAFDRLRSRLVVVWPGNEPRTIRWPLTIKLARR